jgi:hypothetical protein
MSDFLRTVLSQDEFNGNRVEHQRDSIVWNSALRAFAFGILFCCLSDTSNQLGNLLLLSKLAIWSFAAVTLFLPRLKGVSILLTLLVAGRALDGHDGIENYTTASIWISSLGPLTPSLIIFFITCCHVLRYRLTKPPAFITSAFFIFALVPLLIGYAFDNFSTSLGVHYAKTDLRLSLMLLSGIYLFHLLFTQIKDSQPYMLGTLLGALAARHLVDFFASFSATGVSFGNGNIVSLCPTKGMIIFLLLVSLLLSLDKKYFAFGSLGCLTSTYLITAYNSRGLYVMSAISIAFMIYLLALKDKVRIALRATVFCTLGVIALFYFRPDTAFSSYYRLQTLFEGKTDLGGVGAEYNYLSRICPIRYATWKNIFNESIESFSLLTGKGLGGSFGDSACSIPVDAATAFPIEQSIIGEFFYAHDIPSHFVLKYGLVGLVTFISYWFFALRNQLVSPRNDTIKLANYSNSFYGLLMVSMTAFVPTAIQTLWWSGKGIFLSALLITVLKWRGKPKGFEQKNDRSSFLLAGLKYQRHIEHTNSAA